ncbi:MAG: HD domain-containing protein [Proteobacteria bacterium]|nr:HD domain-containing protein [Pseudomonadota bacterium]
MGIAFLLVERGYNAGSRIELRQFPVSLGRDSSNGVIIRDVEASRHHVRIKKRGRLFILEDLDSRNGTYINGDRVINSTLDNGDRILIGSTEFTFVAPDNGIHIATDLMRFDMQLDEPAGIKGPIELEHPHRHHLRRAIRLDPASLANNIMSNTAAIGDIFNYHSNLIVIKDLNETCNSLLKSAGKIISNASRAAIFIWSDQTRQLIPYAIKNFKEEGGFLLSKSAFEDALSRKQGILLNPDSQATQGGRSRVILPVSHNEEIIALVHIEIDNPKDNFSMEQLETTQALLQRSSPIIESMLLRKELDSWLFGIIDTMMSTIEAKDTYTRGHSERVSTYCLAIADELKLHKDIKRLLLISSLCHDIGKIGIPDAILKKAGMLSSEEYAEMKLHPTIGSSIISHLPNAQRIISGVKYHHEKWDGTGYPEGLAGEDIPFFGRIVAISDVFDAMVSGRVYSGFMDQDEAVEKLMGEADLFDPEILKAFARACEKGTLSLKTSTQNNEIDEDIKNLKDITKSHKID